jgi:hypothetical protein
MRTYLLIAAISLTPILIGSTAGQDPAESMDDAAVYGAVIDHTLRDSFRSYAGRETGAASATIQLVGRTVSTCESGRDVSLGCSISSSDIEVALNPALNPNAAGDRIPVDRVPAAATREELKAQFRLRNATSRPLARPRSEDVVIVTDDQFREVSARLNNGQRGNYAVFSLPAYSTDGHAIVDVRYICGNLCGKFWIFLLEKVDSKWRVQGSHLLGIA